MTRLRTWVFFGAWLAALGAYGDGGGAAAHAELRVIDATPPFWAFWEASQGKPRDERVRLFIDIVVAAHPELFDTGVLQKSALTGGVDRERATAVVAAYLDDVPPYIARMRQLSADIGSHLRDYAQDFTTTFPDFAPESSVYFTVSMFSFDGATREIGGRTALLFGIDGIARYQAPDTDLKILFDHELFHQYHDQIAPELTADDVPLWMSLWEEGLATYVSERMNPGSRPSQVLGFPPDLTERARPKLRALATELLANFDSTDQAEYDAFFYASNGRPDLPPRSGYYVGYRIASALGAGHTLPELARLKGAQLKAAVAGELSRLARQD